MTDLLTSFGGLLLHAALPVLATGGAALLTAILSRYLRTLGLELTAAQDARIKVLARDAILATEERSRRAKMSSAEKQDLAIALVRQTVPDLPLGEAHRQIDAALPAVRATLASVPSHPGTFGR